MSTSNQASQPSISVIVLNYNARQYLHDCFSSLMQTDYPRERCELICVDNASTDDSLAYMQAHFPEVRIIANARNVGFAAGNNVGARAALGEYVAFLNPDMRVEPEWLRQLISARNSAAGVACAAAQILDWDGRHIDFADAAMNFMGWGWQPEFGSIAVNNPREPKQLLFGCGGAQLVDRQLFLSAGGFDEDYFAFFEDVDLGWRLNLMGSKTVLAPSAIVYHHHHGSWAPVHDAQKWLLYERNALFTVIKNYDEDSLARVLPAILLLLAQRAYLDIGVDPRVFGFAEPRASLPAFGPRHYLEQFSALLRRRAYGELARRSRAELGRRWWNSQSSDVPAARPLQMPCHNSLAVPALALSRLLAAQQVRLAFPELMDKRQFVQAQRRRPDAQLFPLFHGALASNFADSEFICALNFLIARFDLASVFNATAFPPADQQLTSLSRKVSLDLLDMMAAAFDRSGIAEELFIPGGAGPQSTVIVATDAIAILADVLKLMWTLPAAPVPDVLHMLSEGCERIKSSYALEPMRAAQVVAGTATHA